MFVKKFEAQSLEKALQLVKTELGPNALIISTNRKKDSWFAKSTVEVTAAIDKKSGKEKGQSPQGKALDDIFPHRKETNYPTAPQELKKKRNQKYIDIEGEPEKHRGGKPASSKYEESFLKLGISPELAKDIAHRLAYDYPKSELQNITFLEKAKTRLLASGLKTLTLQELTSRSSWVALGTPGAGKTSLLVKLALTLRNQKIPVSLIGCDERKIVGRSELSAYARLIKVPFHAEIAEDKTSKLQLIDSPALSLKESEDKSLLNPILQDQARTSFLVLDSTSRLSEIQRVVDYALTYSPRAIAFTRLDLAFQRGVLYDVLKSTKLPLLGLSESPSFKVPFRSFTTTELASYILGKRGNNE
jgi:flagellar biosynthesis protein FlhF